MREKYIKSRQLDEFSKKKLPVAIIKPYKIKPKPIPVASILFYEPDHLISQLMALLILELYDISYDNLENKFYTFFTILRKIVVSMLNVTFEKASQILRITKTFFFTKWNEEQFWVSLCQASFTVHNNVS